MVRTICLAFVGENDRKEEEKEKFKDLELDTETSL
jgi:hypothetical protein